MNEILIYDDIGEGWFGDGVTDKSIKAQLDSFNGQDADVRFSSLGGDVFHGFAIYNLFKQYPGKLTGYVDSVAASAAATAAMGVDELHMSDVSMLMIHNPATMVGGEASDMRKTAETLDKIKLSIVESYAAKTGLDHGTISDMMDDETWFTADEAIDQGFANDKVNETPMNATPSNSVERAWINKMPDSIKAMIENKPPKTVDIKIDATPGVFKEDDIIETVNNAIADSHIVAVEPSMNRLLIAAKMRLAEIV